MGSRAVDEAELRTTASAPRQRPGEQKDSAEDEICRPDGLISGNEFVQASHGADDDEQ